MNKTEALKRIENAEHEIAEAKKYLEEPGYKLDKYYIALVDGETRKFTNRLDKADRYHHSAGTAFKTPEEAKTHFRWNTLDTTVRRFARDYNGDWEADWNNGKWDKYFFKYTNRNEALFTESRKSCQSEASYFKDANFLEELKSQVSESDLIFWLTYNKPSYDLE